MWHFLPRPLITQASTLFCCGSWEIYSHHAPDFKILLCLKQAVPAICNLSISPKDQHSQSEGCWQPTFPHPQLLSPQLGGCSLYVLDPGLSTSRTMWVMPALYPKKAVRWTGLDGSSLGKLFTFPRCLLLRFRGKKPKDPCLGAENFLWDWEKMTSISTPNPPVQFPAAYL